MERLNVNEIISLIETNKIFEATTLDGALTIKVSRYVPCVCTAIHDGNRLRKELISKSALDDYERWYEEDPFTADFIKSLPITIIGNDSRFEYDLNRAPEDCIYEEAWGKKVWSKKLTLKEKKESLQKHQNYYKILQALIFKLESIFQGCVVYDMHSYNFKRWNREVPLFNIGAENINQEKFSESVESWKNELATIQISGTENDTQINDVFKGRGYNLEFLTKKFKNTLVLATEVKKIYVNEETGESYPEIINELQHQLKEAIINHASEFASKSTTWSANSPAHILNNKNDKSLLSIDTKLYKLLKSFELLAYVNPKNSITEQKRFIKNKMNIEPGFKYSPIKIDAYQLKQQLSLIKTNDIDDVSIRQMYESVINSYFDKIDMLASLDSKKFLYNSLRYFGRPSKNDIKNAQYLLHLPDIFSEPKKAPILPIETVVLQFKHALEEYGIKCKIELSSKVISQVMVINSQKTIRFRPDAKFTQKEVNAMIEHEIGVHLVTTENSRNQKLKIFNLGLPLNTETQEGLAILSETLSGNISLGRLRKLALRVIVVDMMCSGANFIECTSLLTTQYDINEIDAYTIVTRVFRGGGFTKDYLYLSGFVKVLKIWQKGTDLSPLLVGKTNIEFYDLIVEMIDREMIEKPKFITKSFLNPKLEQTLGIYGYILSGLK